MNFLTVQNLAAGISLAAAVLIISAVVYLILTSSKKEDTKKATKKVERFRSRYFIALVIVAVAGFVWSMSFLPYAKKTAQPEETYTVVAMQWAWKMGPGELEVEPREFSGSNDLTVPAGKLLRFNVTSQDVNHGFGIYDSEGRMLAQTQAMPGFTNPLDYEFTEPGEYHILCMEYCGVPHDLMMAKIHVE